MALPENVQMLAISGVNVGMFTLPCQLYNFFYVSQVYV